MSYMLSKKELTPSLIWMAVIGALSWRVILFLPSNLFWAVLVGLFAFAPFGLFIIVRIYKTLGIEGFKSPWTWGFIIAGLGLVVHALDILFHFL